MKARRVVVGAVTRRATALRRLRGRPSGETGLSLPELLVTMLMLGVLGSLVLTLVVSMNRAFGLERAASGSTSVAAVAMNEMTRVLRTSVPGEGMNGSSFESVGEKEIVLHTLAPGADPRVPEPSTTRVRIAVEPGRGLVEERWAVDEPSPFGAPDSTRTLAPDGDVEFAFADASVDHPETITTVDVDLTVQADPTGRAAPVTLRTTVLVPPASAPPAEP